jgi:hypothetical protein
LDFDRDLDFDLDFDLRLRFLPPLAPLDRLGALAAAAAPRSTYSSSVSSSVSESESSTIPFIACFPGPLYPKYNLGTGLGGDLDCFRFGNKYFFCNGCNFFSSKLFTVYSLNLPGIRFPFSSKSSL